MRREVSSFVAEEALAARSGLLVAGRELLVCALVSRNETPADDETDPVARRLPCP